MPAAYKRRRGPSAYEEGNVTAFVASCLSYTAPVSFHAAGTCSTPAPLVLIVGTASELAAAAVKALPVYDDNVAACIAGTKEGSVTGTFTGGRRIVVGVVAAEASRTNCPARPDSITKLVRAAIADVKDPAAIDIFACCAEELVVATAVAKGLPPNFSAKKGAAEKTYTAACPTVRVFFPGAMKSTTADLSTVATMIGLCQRLLDAPTNLVDTTTFTEIAHGYATRLGCGIDIIAGEELRERGYGGVYGVGKAAEFPPALVTLSYKPKGDMDPKQKIAFVGKGIVYDTGGLAIKTPATFMCGMKGDMGGAAAVLCGFLASVMLKSPIEMSCTLCLADNAISANAQRNDDIVRMKSGLTIEINNTDAEGRLVLGDGVYHASSQLSFTPTAVVDMATLTGAQGIATGQKHAGLFVNDADAEKAVVAAGLLSGDTCFPMLYCPEYHEPLFASTVADFRNHVSVVNDASSSCAGYFVGKNLAKEYKGHHVHVDLAFPSKDAKGGTGFGVALIVKLYAAQHLH